MKKQSSEIKNFFSRIKIHSLILAVVALILGIAALMRPDAITLGLCRILGAGILIVGAAAVITFFTADHGSFLRSAEIVFGVIFSVGGIWILAKPTGIVNFVYILLGILLIINGLLDLQSGTARGLRRSSRTVCLIFAAAMVALGIVVVLNPFKTGTAVMRFAGISLIADAVSSFLVIWKTASAVESAMDSDITIDADQVTME